MVFDRRIAGRVLDFGTTGKLRHSDLVMYDRQTDSWWQQFTGGALAGALAGARLTMLPARIVSFGEFRAAHPEGPVLVPNDPNARRYGVNPYVGYDGRVRPLPFFTGDLPVGLPAMARVVVARTASGTVSVSLAHLAARGQLTRAGFRFAWTAGTASALDRAAIASSRDVGAVSVTGPDGSPAVHDVTFAFVLLAFEADSVVLTEAGAIRLADGSPAQ
jgi:hypothetical protein